MIIEYILILDLKQQHHIVLKKVMLFQHLMELGRNLMGNSGDGYVQMKHVPRNRKDEATVHVI